MSDKSSDSDSIKDLESEPSLTWIWSLTKVVLCSKLSELQITFSESDTINKLRKKLVKHIRSTSSQVNTKTEKVDDLENKDNKSALETNNQNTDTIEYFEEEMANENSTKLEFQVGVDDWETYTERIELYFIATGVTDENKKKAILLTKISKETYKLVRDLCSPAKPKDKKFEELVKILKDHLCPKPVQAIERYNFHKPTQASSEIADYIARLKNLSINCGFDNVSDALRDQLVCGITDEKTKTELFRKENLTFEDAQKIALA